MIGGNTESLKKVATYKKFEKGMSGNWYVSTLNCYTNGYQFVVFVNVYGAKHSREKVFTNRTNANNFVKRYIDYGYKKVSE